MPPYQFKITSLHNNWPHVNIKKTTEKHQIHLLKRQAITCRT